MEESFFQKILKSKIFFILLCSLLIFISYKLFDSILKKRELIKGVENLKKEMAELESKNKELRKLVGLLNEPSFMEKVAKENFNLKKEGENVYSILNNEINKDEAQTQNKVKVGNFYKWLKFFLEK